MSKPYSIKFWHGTPLPNSQFLTKVQKTFRFREADGTYFWDGNLQEFVDVWGSPFVFYPAHDNDMKYISGIIGISQHGHFGAQ